jgi:protoheme ferro-lyase
MLACTLVQQYSCSSTLLSFSDVMTANDHMLALHNIAVVALAPHYRISAYKQYAVMHIAAQVLTSSCTLHCTDNTLY